MAGPQEPTPMTKLGPKQMREHINALRDYLIAIHIEDWQFNAPKNDFINTPSGVLVKTKTKPRKVCLLFDFPYWWTYYDPESEHTRHYCMRGLSGTIDFDAETVTNVTAYRLRPIGRSVFVPPLPIPGEFEEEITWYFVPAVEAMIELFQFVIDNAASFPDARPLPEITGRSKFWLYMEMHRAVADLGSGHHPHRPPTGPESESIPWVLKLCWQKL